MTGRSCQTMVWLPIHSHNRERDRERDIEKGQGIKEMHMFWRLVRDGNGLQFLFLFASVGWDREAQSYILYFLTPDPPAFQRLTSIAACSESGRIQRQPIHPWLRADWRPSVRRSEPTLTSADSPKNVRQETTTLQQWHGNAKLQKKKKINKFRFISLLRKIRRNSALTLFYTWWTHQ